MRVHRFGDRMVSSASTTTPTASQSETIRFGTLEFPAVPHDGLRAPPLFQPFQSFHFGSLEFITDQLGTLRLREEEATPAAPEDVEEPSPPPSKPIRMRRRRVLRSCIKKRRPTRPTRAVLRRITLMMALLTAIISHFDRQLLRNK